MITIKELRELYRIENKYWQTGDTDILPKYFELAKKIDKRFYSEIGGITRIVTQKHYPVSKLVEVLSLLGFKIETFDGETKEPQEEEE